MENKIYFIIGPTASGKTRLSIDLAKTINGEIINCDAFSFYKNCSIMTAKVTASEKKTIPHHMIDFLEIKEKNYNIIKFREKALKKIKEISKRKKIPIIVGGSNYYLESLLFSKKKEKNFLEKKKINFDLKIKLKKNLEEKNYEEIKKILKENNIDLEFHKNDKRRIKNFVLRFLDENENLNLDRKNFLFKNAIYIILENNDENFIKFLIKKRIKEMIFENEGLKEIFFVLKIFLEINNNFENKDFFGVLQSIGYKEFIPYFLKISKRKKKKIFKFDKKFFMDLKNDKNEFYCDLEKSLEKLKENTLNLYKKQKKWINNRIKKNDMKNFIIGKIEKKIIENKNTMDEFFSNLVKKILNFKIEKISDLKNLKNNKKKIFLNKCEFCDKEMRGEKSWKMHINSKKHKIIKRKKNQIKKNYISLKNFKCEKCDINLKGENNYRLHIKSKKHKK